MYVFNFDHYNFLPESIARYMYQFTRAAVTKYHKLSGLNDRNVLSLSSREQKSMIKVLEELVPAEGCERGFVPCPQLLVACWLSLSGLGLKKNLTDLHIHLFMSSPCGCVSVQIFPFYKDTSYIRCLYYSSMN